MAGLRQMVEGDYYLSQPGLAIQGASAAWKAMKPTLSTGFSALNFIYELKDFKKYFEKRKKPKKPKTSLVQKAAETHLETSFGILPFISDCKKIYDILKNLKIRVARFLSKAEALQNRRHFRRLCEPSDSIMLRTIFGTGTIGGLQNLRFEIRPSLKSMFDNRHGLTPEGKYYSVFTMDFSYTVQQLIEMDTQIAALLQSFGVKPDASIIWNGLPFTFLVDWFFSVGDYIEQRWNWDLIYAVVTINDWIESCKGQIQFDLYVPQQHVFSETPGSYLYVPEQEFPDICGATYYYRRSSSEEPAHSVPKIKASDGLTLSQAALTASLLKTVFHRD
jgi:hypothetical protein